MGSSSSETIIIIGDGWECTVVDSSNSSPINSGRGERSCERGKATKRLRLGWVWAGINFNIAVQNYSSIVESSSAQLNLPAAEGRG